MYTFLAILVFLGLLAPSLAKDSGRALESTKQNRKGCGWRNPEGLGVQKTGSADEAKYGEFPWTVAIFNQQNAHVGGGSLIHPSVVLTTAQLVPSGRPTRLRVRAGDWNKETEKELYPHQDRDVKEVVVHPDFNKGNNVNDISLLFLASPVNAAPNVNFACLPNLGARAAVGIRCLASGWGKGQSGNKYQALMKRVEVAVVDHGFCQVELRKTHLGASFSLFTSSMCTVGGSGTCQVDSGSPLVCQSAKDRYTQHGIVAWGVGCDAHTPTVYVDVSGFRSWVDEQVRRRGYDAGVYTP